MTIDFKALKLLENYIRSTTEQPFECHVINRMQIFNNAQWIFRSTQGCFYVVSYDGYLNQWHIVEYLPGNFRVIEGDE